MRFILKSYQYKFLCGNIGEDVLTKFSIILQNDGEKYLEDVSIHVEIPREGGVIVMDHVRSVTVLKHCVPLSECSALKHQQNIEAFGKELRGAFGPKA